MIDQLNFTAEKNVGLSGVLYTQWVEAWCSFQVHFSCLLPPDQAINRGLAYHISPLSCSGENIICCKFRMTNLQKSRAVWETCADSGNAATEVVRWWEVRGRYGWVVCKGFKACMRQRVGGAEASFSHLLGNQVRSAVFGGAGWLNCEHFFFLFSLLSTAVVSKWKHILRELKQWREIVLLLFF